MSPSEQHKKTFFSMQLETVMLGLFTITIMLKEEALAVRAIVGALSSRSGYNSKDTSSNTKWYTEAMAMTCPTGTP